MAERPTFREEVTGGSKKNVSVGSIYFLLITRYYQGHQMKEDEVGEACSMHVSNEKLIQNYFRKM